MYARNWLVQQVVIFPCAFQVDASNLGDAWFYFFPCAIFFHILFFWHRVFMWFRNRVRTSVLYVVLGPLCFLFCCWCCYLLLMLLFVIVHLPLEVVLHTNNSVEVLTVNLSFITNENTLVHPLAVRSR